MSQPPLPFSPPHSPTTPPHTHLPTSIGLLLFPGFQALDVFGALDILNLLSSHHHPLTLSLISSTLHPVSTASPLPGTPPSTFHQRVLPTHTFHTAPPLDVLIVPGGIGTRLAQPHLTAFIAARYPSLQYLLTICTGSALAAQSGVLDGRRATGNKAAWTWLTAQGPAVKWVPCARWTVDGNVWTSSGVAAGIDAVLAWVEWVYGPRAVGGIERLIEYVRWRDRKWDPWAVVYGVEKGEGGEGEGGVEEVFEAVAGK